MAKNIDSVVFRVHVVENLFKVLRTRTEQQNRDIKFSDFLDRDISDTEFIKVLLSSSNADEVEESLNKLRRSSWKEIVTENSRTKYKTFINDTIGLFKKTISGIVDENSSNVSDSFKPVEITDYILRIDNFTSKLDSFSNSLNLTVDMGKSRKNSGNAEEVKLIVENASENDIIILSYKLPGDSKFYVRFVGFITTVKMMEEYGTVSKKVFECFGISKVLSLSSVAADPALSNYQPTDQLGTDASVATPYTNVFSNKNCFDVYKLILNNILFANEDSTISENISESNSLQASANKLLFQANVLKRIEDSLKELQNVDTTSPTSVQHQGRKIASSDVPKTIETEKNSQKEQSNIFVDYATQTGISEILTKYGLKKDRVVTSETAYEVVDKVKALSSTNLTKVDDIINFKFNLSSVKTSINTRSLHINYSLLLTYGLCIKRIFQDKEIFFQNDTTVEGLLGQFDKRIANSLPFDTLLKNGEFKLYYSDFQTPEQILSGLRSTLFLDFFEDRPGKIVCRNPKYNDWPGDKTSQNYIIPKENILSYDISRNDVALKSRSDYKIFTPLVGEQEFTNGNYVDKDIVMQYGFRPDSPRHNPNATTESAASSFASLDLIKNNSSTRTMTLSVKNNKDYKLGYLYFIPELGVSQTKLNTFQKHDVPKILQQLSQFPQAKVITEKDIRFGHVGYLSEIGTSLQPNAVSTHTLSFSLVREAVQIGDYLNFKEIPNILKALKLLEAESVVPNNSFMAELFGDGSKGPLVCGQFIEDEEDSNELKFVACTNTAAIEIKELIKFNADTNQIQARLRELIADGRAFVTGFKKSVFKENSCALAYLLNMLSFWDIYLGLPSSNLNIYNRLIITGITHKTFKSGSKRVYNHNNHITDAIENVLQVSNPLNTNSPFELMPPDGTILNFEGNTKLNLLNMGIATKDPSIRVALSPTSDNLPIAINALEPKKIMPITSNFGVERGALLIDSKHKFVKTHISYPQTPLSGQKRLDIVNIVIPPHKQLSISNIFNGSVMLDTKKESTTELQDASLESVRVNTANPIVDSLILTLTVLEVFSKEDIAKCIQCCRLILNPDNLEEILRVEVIDFSVTYKDILDKVLDGKTYLTIPIRDRVGLRNKLINSLKNNLPNKLIDAVEEEKNIKYPVFGNSSIPKSLTIISDQLSKKEYSTTAIVTQNLDTDTFTSTSQVITDAVQGLKDVGGAKAVMSIGISILKDFLRGV